MACRRWSASAQSLICFYRGKESLKRIKAPFYIYTYVYIHIYAQAQKKRAWTQCAVCDTTPRGGGRARRLREGRVREGRD